MKWNAIYKLHKAIFRYLPIICLFDVIEIFKFELDINEIFALFKGSDYFLLKGLMTNNFHLSLFSKADIKVRFVVVRHRCKQLFLLSYLCNK